MLSPLTCARLRLLAWTLAATCRATLLSVAVQRVIKVHVLSDEAGKIIRPQTGLQEHAAAPLRRRKGARSLIFLPRLSFAIAGKSRGISNGNDPLS
jgi:hypothetical protein